MHAGQAVIVPKGEWVQYSTPDPAGAEYIAWVNGQSRFWVSDDMYVSAGPGRRWGTLPIVTGSAEFRRELGEAAGVALGRIIGFERLSSLTD